jgi:hypothetical protein
VTAHPSEISCHRSFGYDKAELPNFAVDSRRSPRRVLDRHAFNEIPQFPVDLRPAAPGSGAPAPIETKTGTVPADDRFRFHDDENLAPAGPQTPKGRPEQSVEGAERRPRALSFEDSDLLAKREDLKSRIGPVAEENANGGEEGENAMSHEMTVVKERQVGDGLARREDSNH